MTMLTVNKLLTVFFKLCACVCARERRALQLNILGHFVAVEVEVEETHWVNGSGSLIITTSISLSNTNRLRCSIIFNAIFKPRKYLAIVAFQLYRFRPRPPSLSLSPQSKEQIQKMNNLI